MCIFSIHPSLNQGLWLNSTSINLYLVTISCRGLGFNSTKVPEYLSTSINLNLVAVIAAEGKRRSTRIQKLGSTEKAIFDLVIGNCDGDVMHLLWDGESKTQNKRKPQIKANALHPSQTKTNIECFLIIIAMSFVLVLIRTNTKNANTNMNEALPEWWQIASKQNSLDDWTNAQPTGLALKAAKPWTHFG